MAQERLVTKEEHESLWKKSNAFKIGIGVTVAGVAFNAPVAVIGLSTMILSAGWHSEKNPLRSKKG